MKAIWIDDIAPCEVEVLLIHGDYAWVKNDFFDTSGVVVPLAELEIIEE